MPNKTPSGIEVPPGVGAAVDLSARMEAEARQQALKTIANQAEKVKRLVTAVEAALLAEEATWQEWVMVITAFNDRNDLILTHMPMKGLKDLYDQHDTSSATGTR